ncbi:hypothetical protein SLEP1_g24899 [Rubroshorea leprosula]|uniref:Uncharacterized protein n=1 Tax=Rubroshorea leprosula TaxID=152421 RepID=A0AAV5JH53_9ROSI|nr:hypothetical protein SLEP1_g24899 [Rubroshorea leprosula]
MRKVDGHLGWQGYLLCQTYNTSQVSTYLSQLSNTRILRESITHISAVDFDGGLHQGQEPIGSTIRSLNLSTCVFGVSHGLILLGVDFVRFN